jgi:uncharacterized membrane protein YcaP (DUF421 family)
MEQALGIILRASITYVYFLILLRLTGKRVIGEATPFDFIVALVVGDMPDDMIWGDVPVAQGLTGIGTVVLLHVLVAYISFRSAVFDRLVASRPSPVLRGPLVVEATRRREHLSDGDISRILREHQIESRSEIEEAILEPTGRVSIRRREEAKPAQKRDLPLLREAIE